MSGTLNGVRYFGKTNRQRYEVVGDWDHVNTNEAASIYVADLRDKRTGDVFRQGAWKVTATSNKRSALFFGETAWSDAERLYFDLDTARRHDNLRPGASVKLY